MTREWCDGEVRRHGVHPCIEPARWRVSPVGRAGMHALACGQHVHQVMVDYGNIGASEFTVERLG